MTTRSIATFVLPLCLLASRAFADGGRVDYLGTDTISGWACKSDGRSRWLHFFDGTTYIGSTPSNTVQRTDKSAACNNKPYVGFEWAMPKLSPGSHTIKTYVNDSPYASTATLVAGDRSLTVPAANFVGPSPFGVTEAASATSISGWACDLNSGGQPIYVDIFVELDGVGPKLQIGHVLANTFRSDVTSVCGGNGNAGFSFAIPHQRGGNHRLIARAVDVGLGQDRLLEVGSSVPNLVAFPHTASINTDPSASYGSSCWTTKPPRPGCLTWSRFSSCPSGFGPYPGTPLWVFAMSEFSEFGKSDDFPCQTEPFLGYTGVPTRLRYDGLAFGGTVLKINTTDNVDPSAHYPIPYANPSIPCAYQFQALQTNMPGIDMAVTPNLYLEANIGVRADFNSLGFDDTKQCQANAETGSCPWTTAILGVVFQSKTSGRAYFVEVVPYAAESGSCVSIMDHVGCASVPGMGCDSSANYNFRVRLSDSRIASAVSTVRSTMLWGEQRAVVLNLRELVLKSFPVSNPAWGNDTALNNLVFTGANLGTEQYGPARVALDVRRLGILSSAP